MSISNFKGNFPLYISYLLITVDFQSHSGKSGVPGINRNDIHQLQALRPPFKEQILIANALSDTDALITSLEKLIAKKRAIKTAAMQQLLTGKKRLPPFDKGHTGYKQTELGEIPIDWEVKPLDALINSVEYGSSAKSKNIGMMPVLRMGNLQDGIIDWKKLMYTSDTNEIDKYQLKYDDVLFNRTNTVDLVGKTSIYKSERAAIFAGYLIRINKIDGMLHADYLNYTLNSFQSRKYGRLILSVAVSQANINGQKLKTYPIPTPPDLAEQTAIAKVLTDMNEEIKVLKQRLNKTQQIKQGMMQELLTGKTRLIKQPNEH